MAAKTVAAKKRVKIASSVSKPRDSDEPRVSKKATIIIFVVLVVALIGGLVTWFVWPEKDYTYQGIPFTVKACPGTEIDCYYASLNIDGTPYEIPFESHPTQVENILFEYPVLDYLRTTRARGNATVIIGVPEGSPSVVGIAGSQLGRVLGTRYGILNMGVVARTSGTGVDQVDCRHATQHQYVILFEQKAPAGVFVRSPNCIVVQAETAQGLLPVVDAYVYRILGIIPTLRPSSNSKPLLAPPAARNSSIESPQLPLNSSVGANNTAAASS